MRIPPVVKEFGSLFLAAGYQCYLVGGAVRNALMGRPHTDYDIATDAVPEEVTSLFRRVIPTGIKHGTVTVPFKGTIFEVTTFRTESTYSNGRRPDAVSFAPTIFDDLSRRDFTINALAYDLGLDKIIDPYNGRKDLANRVIRAIGNPAERFNEDGLRPLRACRIAAQLSFKIDETTREAIAETLDVLAKVSAERVRDELLKTLESSAPSIGFFLMRDTGILRFIIPELLEGIGVEQGSLHCYDVFTHSLYACDAAPQNSLVLRLAALFHDIGKPRTRSAGADGHPTFYTHEKVSASMTEAILLRLKVPLAVVKEVIHLVTNHMFNYQEEWSDTAVRRLISRVGEQKINDLIALRRADQIGMCRENAATYPQGLADFASRAHSVMQKGHAFTVHQLVVNGNDIMAALAIPPGPSIGIILQELLQSVLDDPNLNDRTKLLEIASRLHHERLGG